MADKTLPSITVTDAQYARLARIIPGDTATEKAAAYKTMDAREAANAAIRDAEQAALDNADNL